MLVLQYRGLGVVEGEVKPGLDVFDGSYPGSEGVWCCSLSTSLAPAVTGIVLLCALNLLPSQVSCSTSV